ncbi:hypothetical protein EV361DRAFT_900292 [Lentinula raphanica]|uniref:Uncharacterized protein n=1 Tax=Lentinula raphanica TaxID=153919 RepID=A0AA38PJH7_9AGAR|nr:hypothetical protein F5878DRAFT_721142 [Lentinula raphanica]KAJ3973415.1 hypothetical protein EV361DRAFT_900292 [Lentinula raphanica]
MFGDVPQKSMRDYSVYSVLDQNSIAPYVHQKFQPKTTQIRAIRFDSHRACLRLLYCWSVTPGQFSTTTYTSFKLLQFHLITTVYCSTSTLRSFFLQVPDFLLCLQNMRLNAAVFLACNIFAQVVIHVSATPVPTPTVSPNELSTGTADQADKAHEPSGQQGRKVVLFSFCYEEEKAKCQRAPEDSTTDELLEAVVNSCVAVWHGMGGEPVQMKAKDHFPVPEFEDVAKVKRVFKFVFEDALGIEGEGVARIYFGESSPFLRLSIDETIQLDGQKFHSWKYAARPVYNNELMLELRRRFKPVRKPSRRPVGCVIGWLYNVIGC